MKIRKKIATILVALLAILPLTACHENNKLNYEKTILTKQQCIDEAKAYLEVSDIYFFDCDFSNMKNIKITDISYNISVSGTKMYSEKKQHDILDLSESASIQIVTNYRIENYNDCFGFSIINEIMIPKWRNKECNILFNENTFSKFDDLYYQGDTLYTYTSSTDSLNFIDIKIDSDFYPKDIIKCPSIFTDYYKTIGTPLSENFDIICEVMKLKSYFYSKKDIEVQKEIKAYLSQYAQYKKF